MTEYVLNEHGNPVCPVCRYEPYCLCQPLPSPDEARRIVGDPNANVIVIPTASERLRAKLDAMTHEERVRFLENVDTLLASVPDAPAWRGIIAAC